MSAQRCCVCEPTRLRTCKICGEAFAIVRKPGRPRDSASFVSRLVGRLWVAAGRAADARTGGSCVGVRRGCRGWLPSLGRCGLMNLGGCGVNIIPSRVAWCAQSGSGEMKGGPAVSTFRRVYAALRLPRQSNLISHD